MLIAHSHLWIQFKIPHLVDCGWHAIASMMLKCHMLNCLVNLLLREYWFAFGCYKCFYSPQCSERL